jgi:hypothetical protein
LAFSFRCIKSDFREREYQVKFTPSRKLREVVRGKYSSTTISESMGQRRNMYRVLVGKAEGKRPLERPRCRWEDGIKMDLRETGWGWCGVDSPGPG